MTDKDKAMQQALELIERLNMRGWILADFETEVYATIDSLKAALEQPVQEDSCFCHSGVSLQSVSGGAAPEGYLGKVTLLIDGEYVDYVKAQPPLPVQEPVSMRMPKVGDRIVCLEDESLGKVVSLTAGGSPDILFDDGSHGTYLLREFAELFGYAEQRQWVGLTEFQFAEIYNKWTDANGSTPWGLYHAIEKALKAKNHG